MLVLGSCDIYNCCYFPLLRDSLTFQVSLKQNKKKRSGFVEYSTTEREHHFALIHAEKLFFFGPGEPLKFLQRTKFYRKVQSHNTSQRTIQRTFKEPSAPYYLCRLHHSKMTKLHLKHLCDSIL